MKRLLAIAAVLGAAGLGWTAVGGVEEAECAEECDAGPATSGTAPELAGLRGRPVVLAFWAPWCGPCRTEIPELNAFAADNPDVHVIGLAVDGGSVPALARLQQRLGMDYPVAPAGDLVARFGVTALPTTVLLDAEGQVATVHRGMATQAALERALARAR